MSTLAYIPARTGSKGIPNKNFLPLAGKPLYVWSVDAAAESEYVDRIVVSIDNPAIIDPVRQTNGKPVFIHERKPEHATDEAQIESGMIDCLKWLRDRDGYEPDFVVLLQPTSPFRPPGIVDDCLKRLIACRADSVLTGCFANALTWKLEDEWVPGYSLTERLRRQDAFTVLETGSVFVTRRHVLVETGCRCGGKVEMMLTDSKYRFEIDEPFDLWLVEKVMKYAD